MGHKRHHRRLLDVRGRRLGDLVGGLEGGSQLGHGGGRLAQGGHHEEKVVGVALAGDCSASHDLGSNFRGAFDAGAAPRVLTAQQGQEAPVKLGKREKKNVEKREDYCKMSNWFTTSKLPNGVLGCCSKPREVSCSKKFNNSRKLGDRTITVLILHVCVFRTVFAFMLYEGLYSFIDFAPSILFGIFFFFFFF